MDEKLENNLYNNEVYDSWQFVVNTERTINIADFCMTIIGNLIGHMAKEHAEWMDSLFSDLFSQEEKVKSVSVTTDSLPVFKVPVADSKVPAPFLLDKLVKDFFQYSRNTFDSISQIVNAALLANNSKLVDKVDFPAMLNMFKKQTYLQAFPDMASWYSAVDANPKFVYIDAFNNRTKHTCDINLKLSMDMFGSKSSSEISPFYRKDVQHDKQDIITYLADILDYVKQSFDIFLGVLAIELPKKSFVVNRYHHLQAYQQKMKANSESDFSVVYLDSICTIEEMPDEIRVLFVHEYEDGSFASKNCEIDTILVRKAEHNYIGRYIATEAFGDDTLVKYRKYKKDAKTGMLVYIDAMNAWKRKPVFYHWNPYMSFTTVSDDEEFINRIQLPF